MRLKSPNANHFVNVVLRGHLVLEGKQVSQRSTVAHKPM
jgi:hypothetical protein